MKQWNDTAGNDLRKWVLFGKVHMTVINQPDRLINMGLKWEVRITSIKMCWLSDKWNQMDNDVPCNFYCA